MKFQIIKYIFLFFYLSIFIIDFSFAKDAHISQKAKIENAIYSIKKNGHNAKATIASMTENIFDYEYFFKSSIPNIWSKMNDSEKNNTIKLYNQYFINKYFIEILSCKDIDITLEERNDLIVCNYKCSNSRDKRPNQISFIKSGNKIADIRFKGMSFLKNEGMSIKNKFKNYNKEDFLNEIYNNHL
jgi:hypothetical protein